MTLTFWILKNRKKKQVRSGKQQSNASKQKVGDGEVNVDIKRRRHRRARLKSQQQLCSSQKHYKESSSRSNPSMDDDYPYRTRGRGPDRPPERRPGMYERPFSPDRVPSRRRPRRDDLYENDTRDRGRSRNRGRSVERGTRPTYDKYHRVIPQQSPEGVNGSSEAILDFASRSQVRPKEIPEKFRRSLSGAGYERSEQLSPPQEWKDERSPKKYVKAVAFALPRYCTTCFFAPLFIDSGKILYLYLRYTYFRHHFCSPC